jgi:hypothetical protein
MKTRAAEAVLVEPVPIGSSLLVVLLCYINIAQMEWRRHQAV